MLTQHNRDEVTAELLGIEATAIYKAVSDLPEGSDNRALVIALGLVLGSLESHAGKDAGAIPLRSVNPVMTGSTTGTASPAATTCGSSPPTVTPSAPLRSRDWHQDLG